MIPEGIPPVRRSPEPREMGDRWCQVALHPDHRWQPLAASTAFYDVTSEFAGERVIVALVVCTLEEKARLLSTVERSRREEEVS